MIRASIVIPTFNRLGFLRNCLDALGKQSCDFEAFEVIVVIDGSTDGTEEYLRKLETPFELRYFARQNQGRRIARNFGAGKASGDYLIFIDDDIVADPVLVGAYLSAMSGAAGMVGLGRIRLDPTASPDWYSRCFAESWNERYEKLLEQEPQWMDLYSGNFCVERAEFSRVGGFATDIEACEDIELGQRLSKNGNKFVYVPRAAATHIDLPTCKQLIARSSYQGREQVPLLSKHPSAMRDLAIIYRNLATSKRAIFRVLHNIKCPAAFLTLFRLVLPTRLMQRRLHKLIQQYAFWSALRGAMQRRGSAAWDTFSRGVTILMYHAFAEKAAQAVRFVIPVERFARQMRWLYENDYRVVSLVDFTRLRNAGDLAAQQTVVLTVDDGYHDFLSFAEPVLERYGFRATVFLVTGQMGTTNAWDAHSTLSGRRTLSWSDARQLIALGHEIGAHSQSHPYLTGLPADQARAEIAGSKRDILQNLGVEPAAFAYPYGDVNGDVMRAVRDIGFGLACTVNDGANHPGIDDHSLHRTEIPGDASLFGFAVRVRYGLNRLKLRRLTELF